MRKLFAAALALGFLISGFAYGFLEKKVVKLGETVPDFALSDTEGKSVRLSSFRGKPVMIHFWSAKCPFVLRYEERFQNITSDYQNQGVTVFAIDSNENEPLDEIKKVAAERKLNYPVLRDPANQVADQFGAVTTPHVYIIDGEGVLRYEGAVDDQGWAEDNTPKIHYVRDALDAVLVGKDVPVTETKTVGCTVKRKL